MTGLVISLSLVSMLTVVMMITLRRHLLKAPATVLIYGVLVCSFLVGGHVYNRLQQQRSYDVCVASVNRSLGNREQHLEIYEELETLDDAEAPVIAAYLRKALDVNLPERSLDECGTDPSL